MTPETIRHLPFAWSLRRKRYWNNCRRKYFLQYYAAASGRLGDPAEICREAWLLSRMVSPETGVRLVVFRTLSEVFRLPEMPESLIPDAEKNLALFFDHLRRDPETCNPVIENPAGCKAREEQERRLFELARNIARKVENSLWKTLRAVPFDQRLFPDAVQQIDIEGLACCFVPVLAYRESDSIVILENTRSEINGSFVSLMHGFYAREQFHTAVPVRSNYFDDAFDLKSLPGCNDEGSAIGHIAAEIRAIREAEMSGFISKADYPCNTGEHCYSCQFRSMCGV